MKRILIVLYLANTILSCSDKMTEANEIVDKRGENNILTLEILNVEPLPSIYYYHTERLISYFDLNKYQPNVCESFVVSYVGSTIKAIYTPLYPTFEQSINMYHVYFKKKGKVSTFDLIISEAPIYENEFRYKYLTKEGALIVRFDVNLDTGIIIDFFKQPNKSWSNRFENCVEWTFNNMNTWDYLACMSIGPICAGVIASMCAVAATERMFVTAEQPEK